MTKEVLSFFFISTVYTYFDYICIYESIEFFDIKI